MKTKAIECPILCGQCCEEWYCAYEATPSYFKGYFIDRESPDCPHMGPKGCKLPRTRRPTTCTHYLCDEALSVLAHGLVREADKAKDYLSRMSDKPPTRKEGDAAAWRRFRKLVASHEASCRNHAQMMWFRSVNRR